MTSQVPSTPENALPLDQAMELELREYNRLFTTHDRREGVAAFNQKRPARFQGH